MVIFVDLTLWDVKLNAFETRLQPNWVLLRLYGIPNGPVLVEQS